MKFFSVSVLALSLVSQVVAEHVPVSSVNARAVVQGVQGQLTSIATTLSTVAGDVVGDLDSLGMAYLILFSRYRRS